MTSDDQESMTDTIFIECMSDWNIYPVKINPVHQTA